MVYSFISKTKGVIVNAKGLRALVSTLLKKFSIWHVKKSFYLL